MPMSSRKQSTSPRNSQLLTLADDDAVEILVSGLTGRSRQRQRDRLRAALEEAIEQYREADEKQRKAFFHGMLTGYAVALKL